MDDAWSSPGYTATQPPKAESWSAPQNERSSYNSDYSAPRNDAAPPSFADNTDNLLPAFVGKKFSYYEKKWIKIKNPESIDLDINNVNWAAFFGGPLWYVYRKMYKETGIILGAYVVLGIIETIVSRQIGRDLPLSYYAVTGIAGAYLLGIVANPAYRRHAERAIKRASSDLNPIVRMEAVNKLGGVNKLAPWIVAALFWLYVIAYVLIVDQ